MNALHYCKTPEHFALDCFFIFCPKLTFNRAAHHAQTKIKQLKRVHEFLCRLRRTRAQNLVTINRVLQHFEFTILGGAFFGSHGKIISAARGAGKIRFSVLYPAPTSAYLADMSNDLFSLKGLVAVVIGGTGELCGAIAEGFASAGAQVVLVGRDPAKAEARMEKIKADGGNGYFIPCDVARKNDLDALLAEVLKQSGRCDILVNGAGVNSATPFLEITEEEYDRIMNINTKATFLACQVFGRYFVENKIAASIINLGSMSGLLPLSRVFTYSMSKGAIHNLSKNLAREWAPLGIRVNTLVPGFFPAEQNKKVLVPERIAKIMSHTPMNRFGSAGELVGAALLLASNTAGSFITGHELVVDGGYSAMTI